MLTLNSVVRMHPGGQQDRQDPSDARRRSRSIQSLSRAQRGIRPYDRMVFRGCPKAESGGDAAQAGHAEFAHQGHPGIPLAVVDTMYR